MKQFLVVVFLVAAFSSALSTGSVAALKGEDEKAVRQLITDLYTALAHNDAAALDKIYAKDYTLVNELGVVTTKAPRLASIKSGELKFETASFDDLSVRLYGNTAVAIYRGMTKYQYKGQQMGGTLRVTLTLMKNSGSWQVLAAHVSKIAAP